MVNSCPEFLISHGEWCYGEMPNHQQLLCFELTRRKKHIAKTGRCYVAIAFCCSRKPYHVELGEVYQHTNKNSSKSIDISRLTRSASSLLFLHLQEDIIGIHKVIEHLWQRSIWNFFLTLSFILSSFGDDEETKQFFVIVGAFSLYRLLFHHLLSYWAM